VSSHEALRSPDSPGLASDQESQRESQSPGEMVFEGRMPILGHDAYQDICQARRASEAGQSRGQRR